MPDIYLSVPYVTQVNIGGHVQIGLGRTEKMGVLVCCRVHAWVLPGSRAAARSASPVCEA